jgi:hypothetical protein
VNPQAPATLAPEKTRYPLYRRLGGPQDHSGRVQKASPQLQFEPGTVQPVASHDADNANPAPQVFVSIKRKVI